MVLKRMKQNKLSDGTGASGVRACFLLDQQFVTAVLVTVFLSVISKTNMLCTVTHCPSWLPAKRSQEVFFAPKVLLEYLHMSCVYFCPLKNKHLKPIVSLLLCLSEKTSFMTFFFKIMKKTWQPHPHSHPLLVSGGIQVLKLVVLRHIYILFRLSLLILLPLLKHVAYREVLFPFLEKN